MSAGSSDEFRCLAIEASATQGSVAVCNGEHVVERVLAAGASSSRQVFRAIREALAEAGLSAVELDCVACGNGPGSFTGVRVAVSATQGIAFSADKPVCLISTLEALAARSASSGWAAACLDARMGEAYVGIYDLTNRESPRPVRGDQLVDPAAFRLADVAAQSVAVGSGWRAWPMMLEGFSGEQQNELEPDAVSLLPLATARWKSGNVVNAADALPNYIRNNVTQ